MSKSFISKYFDFSQALEFLKDGLSVTNTNYNPHFRILLKDNKFILTNFTKVYSDDKGNLTYIAIDGEKAVYNELEYIDIDGTQIELTSENLLVTMQGKEGFAFAGEGEIGVVLDTTITPELKEEGYVREILSKVQNMSEMFANCTNLKELDLSVFTTENVDNYWYMFRGCEKLEKINFSKIDVETKKYLIYILNKFSNSNENESGNRSACV